MTAKNTMLSVRSLNKSFGQVDILNGINFEITEGEFLVLVGPSGCGKSTLLNCIAGLEELTSGDIFINGKEITDVEPKKRDIAMVFQSYALYPTMNVTKNISFGMKVRGVGEEEIKEKLENVGELLQIDNLYDRKPAQLSGGQRQRVAMGRALVRNPTLFLFDEPLSNLDAKLRVEMRSEIKKLHKRLDTTIIYVTHDQIEALSLATKVAVLNGGNLIQLDTPQNIFDRPVNRFVADFIGSPSMNQIPGRLSVEGDVVKFIADGEESSTVLDVSNYQFLTPPENDCFVSLGIRPEYISSPSKAAQEADNRYTCLLNIVLVESNGYDQYVALKFNDMEIIGRFCSDDHLEIGKDIEAQFDLSRISIFCSKTENRL